MNIFAIEKTDCGSIDWEASAKALDNYRVVKMILESTQMICTTINLLYESRVTPYKNAHINHPSTKWVRESSDNFENLVIHTLSMIEEYKERFENRSHKSAIALDKALELYDPEMFPSQSSTPLPLCMPPEFITDDPVQSYRRFYCSKPRMRYPKDKIPKWFEEMRKDVFS